MKRAISISSVLTCLLLQACGAAVAPLMPLPPQRELLAKGQTVFIDVDSGSLDISSEASSAVGVSGQAPEGQTLQVTTAAAGVRVTSRSKSQPFWHGASPLRLDLRVPNGTTVNINSFDAGIAIHDLTGNVTISAVSGDISVRNSEGNFAIKSNRGNISMDATSGVVHLAGNYGLLSMVNSHGTSDASTIMGTVRFSGTILAGDQVSLETDHGPVEIQLGSSSDVMVQIRTTSGVVTCPMPGLRYDGQGCTGTLRAGQGQLKVRTVSGSTTLEQLP